jgi:hypothetical protein
MPRFNDRLFDTLDAAAERTGIPGHVTRPRRRHLRWLPVAALALATLGMVLGLVRTDLLTAGYALIMTGFPIAVMLPIFGPVKIWGGSETVDEFDRAMRNRAFLATFAAISFIAFFAIMLITGLALIGSWPKTVLIRQLVALILYLMTLYSAVPTLYSSWATQPIGEEE